MFFSEASCLSKRIKLHMHTVCSHCVDHARQWTMEAALLSAWSFDYHTNGHIVEVFSHRCHKNKEFNSMRYVSQLLLNQVKGYGYNAVSLLSFSTLHIGIPVYRRIGSASNSFQCCISAFGVRYNLIRLSWSANITGSRVLQAYMGSRRIGGSRGQGSTSWRWTPHPTQDFGEWEEAIGCWATTITWAWPGLDDLTHQLRLRTIGEDVLTPGSASSLGSAVFYRR